jgi:putative membrane protein
MEHGFGTHGWGMDIGMGWVWILGLIILVISIWFIVRTLNQNDTRNQTNNKSALDILKERYARGEITKDEFEEIKKHLNT